MCWVPSPISRASSSSWRFKGLPPPPRGASGVCFRLLPSARAGQCGNSSGSVGGGYSRNHSLRNAPCADSLWETRGPGQWRRNGARDSSWPGSTLSERFLPAPLPHLVWVVSEQRLQQIQAVGRKDGTKLLPQVVVWLLGKGHLAARGQVGKPLPDLVVGRAQLLEDELQLVKLPLAGKQRFARHQLGEDRPDRPGNGRVGGQVRRELERRSGAARGTCPAGRSRGK